MNTALVSGFDHVSTASADVDRLVDFYPSIAIGHLLRTDPSSYKRLASFLEGIRLDVWTDQ